MYSASPEALQVPLLGRRATSRARRAAASTCQGPPVLHVRCHVLADAVEDHEAVHAGPAVRSRLEPAHVGGLDDFHVEATRGPMLQGLHRLRRHHVVQRHGEREDRCRYDPDVPRQVGVYRVEVLPLAVGEDLLGPLALGHVPAALEDGPRHLAQDRTPRVPAHQREDPLRVAPGPEHGRGALPRVLAAGLRGGAVDEVDLQHPALQALGDAQGAGRGGAVGEEDQRPAGAPRLRVDGLAEAAHVLRPRPRALALHAVVLRVAHNEVVPDPDPLRRHEEPRKLLSALPQPEAHHVPAHQHRPSPGVASAAGIVVLGVRQRGRPGAPLAQPRRGRLLEVHGRARADHPGRATLRGQRRGLERVRQPPEQHRPGQRAVGVRPRAAAVALEPDGDGQAPRLGAADLVLQPVRPEEHQGVLLRQHVEVGLAAARVEPQRAAVLRAPSWVQVVDSR
mmetsp:Transcript_53329/g.165436  ORF Transcript_53329/g.165436 Transcript_53329/m.165436 type:complete len:451 (-) Transcript_53329:563-1915(-)